MCVRAVQKEEVMKEKESNKARVTEVVKLILHSAQTCHYFLYECVQKMASH